MQNRPIIRIVAIAVVMWIRLPEGHTSCAGTEPEPATIVVDKCSAVDTSKLKSPATPKSYEGLLIEGMLTAGKGKPVLAKVWVPASEKLACAQAKPKSTVSGTLAVACCDGDPNPPCWIQTSSILTKVTIATQKPVKQATRAELETEVEALRIENGKLRAELEALYAQERERLKMRELEREKLYEKLK